MITEDDKYMGKYFICKECADEKQWKLPDHPITCSLGRCAWCKSEDERTMIPVVDFSGPGKKAIWD